MSDASADGDRADYGWGSGCCYEASHNFPCEHLSDQQQDFVGSA